MRKTYIKPVINALDSELLELCTGTLTNVVGDTGTGETLIGYGEGGNGRARAPHYSVWNGWEVDYYDYTVME